MPRTKPSKLPAYRLHTRSKQAIVTLSGKMHYLGAFDSPESKQKYDDLVGAWLERGREGEREDVKVKVTELVAKWYEHAATHYAKHPTSMRQFDVSLAMLNRLYGSTPAAEFGPLKLRAIREELVKTPTSTRNMRRPRARVTVNIQVGQIQRVFRWAVSVELIPGPVSHALETVTPLQPGRTPAPEMDRVKPVPEDHLAASIAHMPPRIADMVRVQLLTGMRPGEVCAMRWTDVQMAGEVWTYRPPEHKTSYLGLDRVIFIGPQAQEILKQYMKPQMTDPVFSSLDSRLEFFERSQRAVIERAEAAILKAFGYDKTFTTKEFGVAAELGRETDSYTMKRLKARGIITLDRVEPIMVPMRWGAKRRCMVRYFRLTRPTERQPSQNSYKRVKTKDVAYRYQKRWSVAGYWGVIQKAIAAVNRAARTKNPNRPQLVTRWHPHQLRHNHATAIRNEFGLEAASIILGHSDETTTLIYAEADIEKMKKIMREVG